MSEAHPRTGRIGRPQHRRHSMTKFRLALMGALLTLATLLPLASAVAGIVLGD